MSTSCKTRFESAACSPEAEAADALLPTCAASQATAKSTAMRAIFAVGQIGVRAFTPTAET